MRIEASGLAALANSNDRHQRETLPPDPHPEADLHPDAPDGPAVIRLASASSWVSATASLITAYRGRPSPTLLQSWVRRRLSR